jgi:hypothetical protein
MNFNLKFKTQNKRSFNLWHLLKLYAQLSAVAQKNYDIIFLNNTQVGKKG